MRKIDDNISELFLGKTLLISGGTGSFGNAALKHFLQSGLEEIRIFSRDEKKQDDMRRCYADRKVKFYVGDVRNRKSVESAMRGVDYVFHAAALKQVPSCEFFPLEAIATNIHGTDNVLTAAVNNDVERVVVLSTDKAAYPINAMGMSKALMEKVAVARARELGAQRAPVICRTRYGNVMASRGSVIPLFTKQILAGQPVTVTNSAMTRFMMTLDDAVELVSFAFLNGAQGDLFVQKAPAATISTLVAALEIKLGKAANIKHIGERHGEKLFEVLVTKEEMIDAMDLDGYYRIPSSGGDLYYELYTDEGSAALEQASEYNSHNTERLDVEGMVKLLDKLDFEQIVAEV